MLKTVRGKTELFGQSKEDLQMLDKFVQLIEGTVVEAHFFDVRVYSRL
jgi:hypothetical protein